MKTTHFLKKILPCLAALFLLGGVFPSAALAASRWETLEAIHMVENPRNLRTPGSRGELGAYQFRAETWRQHTKMPFSAALDRASSDQVAVKHYEWIKSTLERAGIPATPYFIAMAWNAGVSAVINDRVPKAAVNYATRVHHLAADLQARSSRANTVALADNR